MTPKRNHSELVEIKALARKVENLVVSIENLDNSATNGATNGDIDGHQGSTAYEDLNDLLQEAADELRVHARGPRMFWDTILYLPYQIAAFQVAFEYNLFLSIPRETKDNDDGVSSAKLSETIGLEEDMLVRILRLLIGHQVFREVREKVFAHNENSALMVEDPNFGCNIAMHLDEVTKAATCMTDVLEDPSKPAFEHRFGTSIYEFYERNPKRRARFAQGMIGRADHDSKNLLHMYPWDTVTKVVDVGGGAGHGAKALAKEYSHLHMVVQDLPGVIKDQTTETERVEYQAHDYNDPQPLKDVDAFLLQRCLHNNDDESCIKILKALVPGLEARRPSAPLLITEMVMPEWDKKSAYIRSACNHSDLAMKILFNARERSESEFLKMLKIADQRFEISKVYHGRYLSIIEARLNFCGKS